WRRAVRLEVPPSLERPHRPWRDRNDLWLHHQPAPPYAILVAKRFDADQFLARGNFATDDPIERTTCKNLLHTFRGHPRDMDMMGRLPLLFGGLHPFSDPFPQVLHGVAADAKLDQMERHAGFNANTVTMIDLRYRSSHRPVKRGTANTGGSIGGGSRWRG